MNVFRGTGPSTSTTHPHFYNIDRNMNVLTRGNGLPAQIMISAYSTCMTAMGSLHLAYNGESTMKIKIAFIT